MSFIPFLPQTVMEGKSVEKADIGQRPMSAKPPRANERGVISSVELSPAFVFADVFTHHARSGDAIQARLLTDDEVHSFWGEIFPEHCRFYIGIPYNDRGQGDSVNTYSLPAIFSMSLSTPSIACILLFR
jgi:hypothetical protein